MKICNNCNKTFSDEKIFCEFCGSNLISMNQNEKSKKSNGGNGAIIAIAVLSIFAAISAGFNIQHIYRYSEYNKMKNYIVPGLQEKINSYEKNESKLKEEIDLYEKNESKLKEEIDFYEKYVVLVSDNGTKFYHIYGCEDFDSSSFWAYNLKKAESQGYQPCAKCCWDVD